MEEYESRENRDVENSELLMAEYNAAFQDLNSVVEVTIVLSSFFLVENIWRFYLLWK